MAKHNVLVSIVTPSFNQGAYIEETVQSVLNQTYPNIEYIVVDGLSQDDTLQRLAPYADRLQLVSEADQGQADAINKGFRRATGDILAWINADDVYLPAAIESVVAYFQEHPTHDFVYGDGIIMNVHGKRFGRRPSVRATDYERLLYVDDNILQPAAFWRRELWETIGELKLNLNYMLDYDYWLRAAQHYQLWYIRVPLVCERLHGATKTASGSIERLAELEALVIQHGAKDLPSAFHAEAQVTYFFGAVVALWRRHFRQAGVYFAKSWTYMHWRLRHVLRMMLFAFALLIWRDRGAIILRLYASRLRSNLK